MARRRGSSELPDAPVPTSLGTVELRYDSDGVMVLLDGVESSHLDLDDPVHLVFEYMQQMQVVLRATHAGVARLRVLHLGGAGCALARAIDAEWTDARQIAVEIDAELATLVREWFDLPRSPRLRIRVGDAREQLGTIAPGSLNVVVRDAFSGRSVPDHLRTRELTVEVSERLRPGGLYLANLADSPPLRTARREIATVRSVFDHVVVIAEPAVLKGRRYGNLVIAAAHQPVHRAGLTRALRSLPVPAGIVGEADVVDLAAGASVLTDPAEPEG